MGYGVLVGMIVGFGLLVGAIVGDAVGFKAGAAVTAVSIPFTSVLFD